MKLFVSKTVKLIEVSHSCTKNSITIIEILKIFILKAHPGHLQVTLLVWLWVSSLIETLLYNPVRKLEENTEHNNI